MVCSHLKRAYILINTLTILIGTYHWYQRQVVIMSTNKEHIESLEAGISGLQDDVHRMELGMANKFSQRRPHLTVCLKCFFPTKKAPTKALMSKMHIHVLT
jgi:hypothetical protein